MSVFQCFDGVWHFRYIYKGQVIRRSTRQGNKRVAEDMEARRLVQPEQKANWASERNRYVRR